MSKRTYTGVTQTPPSSNRYASDSTDKEWALIAPELAQALGPGRKRTVNLREVVNAIFYRTRSGCQWRMLPKEFPDWRHVWYYYKKWTSDGTWERINTLLHRLVRQVLGKQADPSLAILDSQTVKTTEAGGERGFDGGKKIKGRKRHILVDSLGLLRVLVVHAANIQDYDGARQVLPQAPSKSSRLQKIIADGMYPKNSLVEWVKQQIQFILEIVTRDKVHQGFVVLPKRWIVERTLAWLGRNRILSKEYEHLIQTSESDVYIASIRLMLRRLNRRYTLPNFRQPVSVALWKNQWEVFPQSPKTPNFWCSQPAETAVRYSYSNSPRLQPRSCGKFFPDIDIIMTEQVHKKLKRLQPRNNSDKPIRVLCVEDTETVRNTIVELLEIYGYQVVAAKNGQEGVEMALRWRPDLVLMDLRMPLMDGYSAIHDIRFNPKTHHIPIFVVSAWDGKKERDKARLVGADDFFAKPPDFNRLSEAIKLAVTASTQK